MKIPQRSSRLFALLALAAGACDAAPQGPGTNLGGDETGDYEETEGSDDGADATAQSLEDLPNPAYIPVLPAHRLNNVFNIGDADVWGGVQVQNLGAASTGLTLALVDWDGTIRRKLRVENVARGASANFIPHLTNLGWNGYAVASSDSGERVSATVNLSGVNPRGDDTNLPVEERDSFWNTSTAGDSYEATTEPSSTFALPYLDIDANARTTIWVTNTDSTKTTQILVEFPNGHSRLLGELGPGAGAGFNLRDIAQTQGWDLDSHRSSFASTSEEVASAQLSSNAADGSGVAPKIAVAVTSFAVDEFIEAAGSGAAGETADVLSMTAYSPPRFGDNIAPLVNFQPANDLDTVIYAQRVDPNIAPEFLAPVPPRTEEQRSTMSMAYSYRDRNYQTHSCSEHVFGVQPGDVVDFGWSFTGRAGGEGPTYFGTTHPYHRTSDCPELQGADVAVGWAKASTNAAVVVTQNYAAATVIKVDGTEVELPRRGSAYAGGWEGAASGNSIAFSLTQSDNPGGPPQHEPHGNWTGISVVNPSDESVIVDCTFSDTPGEHNGGVTREETETVSLGPGIATDIQLYHVWENRRNYGSAICTARDGAQIMGLANAQYGWNFAPMSYRAVALDTPQCGIGGNVVSCGDDGFVYQDATGCGRPVDTCGHATDSHALDALSAAHDCVDHAARRAACVGADPTSQLGQDYLNNCIASRENTAGTCRLAITAAQGCNMQPHANICIGSHQDESGCAEAHETSVAVCGQP